MPLITYLVIAYLLAAFGWWSILLVRKTREIHEARLDRLAYELVITQRIEKLEDFPTMAQYQELSQRFEKQQRMVLGEALLLWLSIIVAAFFLYQSLRKQVSATDQQRNFLLSITHELKSPLSGIRLILETFYKRPELKPEQRQRLAANALAETDRFTALVNDLLLSAKLENAYQINEEKIDLGALIQEAVDRVSLKYRTAHYHVDIEPGLPLVTGDRLGLVSVAVNLLENAAKYSAEPATITTTLQRGGATELVWEVADNGIGIADKYKAQVFQKFFRVGSEDTRRTKGTGLGLFIVKELVQRHGGVLELLDNQPQGSRFRIHLPVSVK